MNVFDRAVFLILLFFPAFCGIASADVIVLANRTGRELPVRFTPVAGQVRQLTLPIGDTLPLYLDGKANVSFSSAGETKHFLLDANCAYFFGRGNGGKVDLQKIGLGEDGTLAGGRSLPGTASQAPLATVTVKILVDEEEPGRQLVWERRLRRRVEAASAVFEKYFHTKLQVVAVETWNSNNDTDDFFISLAEFERKVNPAPRGWLSALAASGQWSAVECTWPARAGQCTRTFWCAKGTRRSTRPIGWSF